MDYHIKFDTVKSGWSVVCTEGPKVKISKYNNNVDPDEMPHKFIRNCYGEV